MQTTSPPMKNLAVEINLYSILDKAQGDVTTEVKPTPSKSAKTPKTQHLAPPSIQDDNIKPHKTNNNADFKLNITEFPPIIGNSFKQHSRLLRDIIKP